MKLTENQCTALTFAAANGLPFAFWRAAGASGFTVLVSENTPMLAPVFGANSGPSFVAAPFDTDDGNEAWHLMADVHITADGARFRSGSQLEETPVTAMQKRIVNHTTRAPLQAPLPKGPQPEPTDRVTYQARVARAVAAIKQGLCQKIVLSRIEPRALTADYDLIDLAEKLATVHPHAFVSVVSSDPTGTLVTATPEILLTANHTGIKTMALAGTQWPAKGTDLSEIQWSDKIVGEQGLVADFIREAFAAEDITDLVETQPMTVQAANLCHLRSDFRAPCVNITTLAALLRRLHPTSAVCGMPRPEAHQFIREEEGDTRGFYTGYLGPVDSDGFANLYVNLRSARVAGHHIYLHIGGGIVAESDPKLEWDETVEKTKTIGCVL